MLKVSIIIPITRPVVAKRCIESIKKNAGIPRDEYEVITAVDKKRIGCPKMVKMLTERSRAQRIMFLGEDIIPQKDFLKEALIAMEKLSDGWGLVALNDGMHMKPARHRPCKLACHWLAHKKLLPLLNGEFFHTGYTHTGCDEELTERCYSMGRYVFAERSIIKHKKVRDKVHKEVSDRKKRVKDAELLKHRRRNKWISKEDTFE